MGSHHSFDDKVVIPSLMRQLDMLGIEDNWDDQKGVYFSAPDIDLDLYDRVILCQSGGKDSIAAFLRLKELGIDMSRVELWHHDVTLNVTYRQRYPNCVVICTSQN